MYGHVAYQGSLPIEGLSGFRDLGGLDRRIGSQTPYGVFYRSATVDRVTTTGWEALHEIGIRSIIDLRRLDEIAHDRARRPSWLTTVNADLDGFENQSFWSEYLSDGRFGTALYYVPHLEAMPERATQVLTAVVSAPAGGVLFHCAGGRDRTGLVTMLLLTAAGVTIDAMTADYMETVQSVKLLKSARPVSDDELTLDEVCAKYDATPESAFRRAAESLDLDRLLDAGGFAPEDRVSLFTWRGSIPR
jgi:protein-tyrosine phosphatase